MFKKIIIPIALLMSFNSMAQFNAIISANKIKYIAEDKIVVPPMPDQVVFTKIASNSESYFGHSYAIDSDKNLWVTGFNGYGQLGTGDKTSKTIWTKTTMTEIEDIAVTMYSGHVIKNGKVYGVGANSVGQIGSGLCNGSSCTTTSFIDSGLSGATKITTSSTGAIYAKKDDTMQRLGKTGSGWVVEISDSVSDISSQGGSIYALKSDMLWSKGLNRYGQLGLGNTVDQSTWQDTGLSGVKEIDAGYTSIYALKNNGELWVAGRANEGQLGILNISSLEICAGSIKCSKSFVKSNISNVKDIGGYNNFAYVIDNNKDLWVTGLNHEGQLGLGNKTDQSMWTKTESNVDYISKKTTLSGFFIRSFKTFVVGKNNQGQLGLGDNSSRSSWIEIPKIEKD